MAKTYKVLMRQILFDIADFEAESEEEAIEMAKKELDPEEIEDNLYSVIEITDENGNVEIPPRDSIDAMIYGNRKEP